MMKYLAVITVYILVGCGDVNVDQPSVAVNTDNVAVVTPWTDAQISASKQQCMVSMAKNTEAAMNTTQANAYCDCMIARMQKSVSYADFNANAKEWIDKFRDDGSIEKCDIEARKVKATATPSSTTKAESQTSSTNTSSSLTPWNARDILSSVKTCTDQVTDNKTANMDRSESASFCSCIIDAAQKIGSYDYFTANSQLVGEKLKANGAFASCEAAARKKIECEGGKICRGMTKDQIEQLLGKPTKIEDRIYPAGDRWIYKELTQKTEICVIEYDSFDYQECSVSFNEKGKVADQENISTKYIDAVHYLVDEEVPE